MISLQMIKKSEMHTIILKTREGKYNSSPNFMQAVQGKAQFPIDNLHAFINKTFSKMPT